MESTELKHYGVRGMKWGVRKKRTDHADYQKAHSKKSVRKKRTDHEDYQKAHSKKSVREMSDKELRERNNRLQMEQQYAQMTKRKNRGAKAVKAIIAGAGTLVALDAAIKTYTKYSNVALDKVGDWVVSGINLSGPLH